MLDTSFRDGTVIVDLIETVSCCFKEECIGGCMAPKGPCTASGITMPKRGGSAVHRRGHASNVPMGQVAGQDARTTSR
jgi:hypothetical protein